MLNFKKFSSIIMIRNIIVIVFIVELAILDVIVTFETARSKTINDCNMNL